MLHLMDSPLVQVPFGLLMATVAGSRGGPMSADVDLCWNVSPLIG